MGPAQGHLNSGERHLKGLVVELFPVPSFLNLTQILFMLTQIASCYSEGGQLVTCFSESVSYVTKRQGTTKTVVVS